jgi:hypothetical protein
MAPWMDGWETANSWPFASFSRPRDFNLASRLPAARVLGLRAQSETLCIVNS